MTLDGEEVSRVYILQENTMPYKPITELCSMPVNFLFNLLRVSRNPEWVMAVIDLLLEDPNMQIQNTELVVMIQDQINKEVFTQVKTFYDVKKVTDDTTKYTYPSGNAKVQTMVRTTYTNTVTAFIQKANTWCLDFEQEVVPNDNPEIPGEDVTTNESYSDEDFSGLSYNLVSTEAGTGSSYNHYREKKTYISAEKQLYSTKERTDVWDYSWNINITTEKKINYEKFLGLWKNNTGKYVKGKKYDPNGKLVGYPSTTDENAFKYPADDIAQEQWQNINELLYILGNHADTQVHELLMMYYWNIYFGENIYDVNETEICNLFDVSTFTVVSGYGSGLGPSYNTIIDNISQEDIELIARTVYAERGGGSQEQQEYVASVILNRVLSSRFPNTVYEVISARGQFSSFQNKNFNSDGYLNQKTQAAVLNVLQNGDTTGGAVYFMTPSAASRQTFINNCIYLFNDVTGERKPTVGDNEWNGTHNFYTTESIQNELGQYANSVTFDGNIYQYYQSDYAHVKYGNGTIASSGCGVTSCAMVVSSILGKPVTPKDIVDWCGDRFYIKDKGTSWALYKEAAYHYNIGKVRQTSNINEVTKALANGNLVISSQGVGLFTKEAHVIVLYKIENGKIYVKDPNKNNAVNKGYDSIGFSPSEINQAAKQYFIFE